MASTPRTRLALLLGALLLLLSTVLVWRALEPLPPRPPPIDVSTAAHGPETGARPGPGIDGAPTLPSTTYTPAAAGPALVGHARTHLGVDVAGASLELELVDAEGAHALARGTSDANGRFHFELEGFDELARTPGLELALRARAVGYQPVRETRSLADLMARAGPQHVLDWELLFVPGQVIQGRAVDAGGRPVAGAELRLFVPSTRGATPVERIVERGLTGTDGRFELGYGSSATCELGLRAEGVGTAWFTGLELSATRPFDLGDVLLDGPAHLSGVAVHAGGAPAAGLELWALPGELRGRPEAAASAAQSLSDRERGVGLSWSRTRTDEHGAFAFAGLRAGDFLLVCPRPRVRLAPAGIVLSAPADGLRVIVSSTRLCVRIVDEVEQPVASVQVSCGRLERDGDGQPTLSGSSFAASGPDGRAWFDVEADTTYALRAELGARAAEELLQLAPGQEELEHTLVLQAEPRAGYLRLSVRGSLGEPIDDYRVSLISALTEERLERLADLAPGPRGEIGPIPPGRYRVEVAPRASGSAELAWIGARAPGEVEIRAGATAALEVQLTTGAALTLELEIGGRAPADFEFVPDPKAKAYVTQAARAAHELAHGASAQLVPAAGAPRSLSFDIPGASREAPPSLASTLLPGRSARVHGRWAAGSYRLRVEVPGFEPFESELTLAAGELRSLHVRLLAR